MDDYYRTFLSRLKINIVLQGFYVLRIVPEITTLKSRHVWWRSTKNYIPQSSMQTFENHVFTSQSLSASLWSATSFLPSWTTATQEQVWNVLKMDHNDKINRIKAWLVGSYFQQTEDTYTRPKADQFSWSGMKAGDSYRVVYFTGTPYRFSVLKEEFPPYPKLDPTTIYTRSYSCCHRIPKTMQRDRRGNSMGSTDVATVETLFTGPPTSLPSL